MKMVTPSKKESVFCSNENEKKLNVMVQTKRDPNKNLFDKTISVLRADLKNCMKFVTSVGTIMSIIASLGEV